MLGKLKARQAVDIERCDLRLAKGEDALVRDSVEHVLSDVGIVKEATDDEVKPDDEERQTPEFEKPAWIASTAVERRKPDCRVPHYREPAPHQAEWDEERVAGAERDALLRLTGPEDALSGEEILLERLRRLGRVHGCDW